MPVRVLDARGTGSLSNVAAGIRYAADNGAHVINLSLGSRTDSKVLSEAIAYAESLGAVIVSAAGNSGAASPVYPAAYATEYGIAVGAVTALGKMPGFSSRAGVHLIDYVVAPGVQVYSTRPGGNYGYDSGTSMATPHVAAIAALLRQALPNASASELESLLTSTANNQIVTV
jgi:subtilisin family serine protease